MTDQSEQQRRFGEAVERKNEAARRRSERDPTPEGVEPVGGIHGDQENLYEHGRPQDTVSAREKSTGHGKKTADKWNQ